MAAFIICSDFGAPKNKVCHLFLLFPYLFAIIKLVIENYTSLLKLFQTYLKIFNNWMKYQYLN